MVDKSLQKGSGEVWNHLWQDKQGVDYLDERTFVGLCEEVKFRCFSEEFDQAPGKRVLECGCGTATMSVKLAQRGFTTTMLDVSPTALALAKDSFAKHRLNGIFVQGDVENLPFADNSFDLVTSFGLLEHFSNVQAPIEEMVRVLCPGGVFLADIIPNKLSTHTPAEVFNRIILFANCVRKGRFKEGLDFLSKWSPDFYVNNMSADEYIALMYSCGLRDVRLRACHPFPDLVLPSTLKQSYLGLLKRCNKIWAWFTLTESRLLQAMAWGWWVNGTKPD